MSLRACLGLSLALLLAVGCVSDIDLTGVPCGENGECGEFHSCVTGVCIRDTRGGSNTQSHSRLSLVVGAACSSISDCRISSSGTTRNAKCLERGSTGQEWPNGYCTRPCSTHSECDPDQVYATRRSVCYEISGSRKECRVLCDSDTDCRNDYRCLTYQSRGVCVPK